MARDRVAAPRVLRGAEGARTSADLVRRVSLELEAARTKCARLRAVLDQRAAWGEGGVEAKAARREALARSSLVARLSGAPESGGKRLVRNVSLHAKRCPQAFSEKHVMWGAGAFVDGLAAGWRLAEACPPCDVGVLMYERGVAAARTPLRSCAKPYLSENAAEACLPEAGAGAAEARRATAGAVPGLARDIPVLYLLEAEAEAATACAAAPTATASSALVVEYLAAHPAALFGGGDGMEHFDEIGKPTCEKHEWQAARQEPETIGFELNDGEEHFSTLRGAMGVPKDDEEDPNKLEAHVSGDGEGDERDGGALASCKEPLSIIEEPTCEEHGGQAEQQEPEAIWFELNDGEDYFSALR
ncbi:unnamed protein product, partial [Prorocentrum cordatum]